MPDKSLTAFFPVSGNLIPLHPIKNRCSDLLILLCSDHTVRNRNDAVGMACVKTGHRNAVLFPYGKLLLVAEAVRILHSCNRMQNLLNLFLREAADADKNIANLLLLKFQLLRILQLLNLTSAALSCKLAPGRGPERGGLYNIQKSGIAIALFHLHNLRCHGVTHHSILDKKRKAVRLSDSIAV
ncbi:unknown [Firmicutes bacterium CAG:791]|nr:unknown [Firmicutes bacterium CAG:791]